MRAAMKSCPVLRDFMERAAVMQATEDFRKEVPQ